MSYIFDPDVLGRIARDALGQPLELMVEQIAGDLTREYPGHIRDDRQWVLNNAGGRIFEQLPIAAQPGVALELWTTPHRLQFEAAAALYGIEYAEVRGRAELRAALAAAYAEARVTLVEVTVAPDNVARSQDAVSADLAPRWAELLAGAPV